MDIDFTTSEPGSTDVQMPTTEDKEPTETVKSELKPMEASPATPNRENGLKRKLETPTAASPESEKKIPPEQPSPKPNENEAPFPPLQSSQDSVPAQPKKKSKLIWIILILLILGGAAYFFLMTSPGKSLIGLGQDEEDLNGLYLTEENSTGVTFPSDPSLTSDFGSGTTSNPTSSTTTTSPSSSSSALTTSSRDSQRKQDLASIKMYIDQYYAKNSKYPVAPVIEKISDPNSVIYKALIPNITTSLPDDPWASDYSYWYGYRSEDSASYHLTARLEDTTDPSGKQEEQFYIYRLISSGAPATTATTSAANPTTSSTTSSNTYTTEGSSPPSIESSLTE